MNTNNYKSSFGLLPEEKRSLRSLGVSIAVNVLIAGSVILLGMSAVHEVHQQQMETHLVFPAAPIKPYIPPPMPKIRLVAPRPPKIHPLPPPPEPPKVVEIKAPTPELPHIATARPKAAAPAPKVGIFHAAAPAPATHVVRPTVHTAGFGAPVGVAPNPSAIRPANIAMVGTFSSRISSQPAAHMRSVQNVTFGSGVGAGSAHARGTVATAGFGSAPVSGRGTRPGTVAIASAGFGSGVVGGTGHSRTGTVVKASFGDSMYGSRGNSNARAPQGPPPTSIVVLSKPLPAYTAEARQLHIEGDVTLQVRFTASGQVEVLRIVRGLGHGLDQQAEQAAERIRFHPATRDGHPVDVVSIIHISFQMA